MSERSLSTEPFDYARAFSRTIGWITTAEQPVLRAKRVAIAGLGGVGGAHLLTLTRLGIQAFNLADFDRFGTENFNRQAGAFQSTVGQPKVEVVSRMARDINPDLDINTFPDGVTPDNMEEFLSGVDLYVDGLDFFVLDIRARLFALCAERGIPAITAAPLGMGAAVLAFLPGRMTFEQYFQLEGQPRNEQLLRFMVGLAPAVLHQAYLVEPSAVDLVNQRGPSTPMACEICAGIAGTQALKILLGRGEVIAAPHGLHFDAYRNKLVRTWRPGGNSNPLQRLILSLARRRFMRK
jgi:molybdopterin/thiamine biosynthesis adenylyltransferase